MSSCLEGGHSDTVDFGSCREDQDSLRTREGRRRAQMTDGGSVDLMRKLQLQRQECDALARTLEEQTQRLESLTLRKSELQNELSRVTKSFTDFDKLHQGKEVAKYVRMAEVERKERIQTEADIKRLKEEYDKLILRKQELQREEQRHAPYLELMQQTLKMTPFTDVHSFADNLESLLYYKEQFYQKQDEGKEEVDQMRKTQLTLEDQHRLRRLQRSNQLSQLQTELEKTRSEVYEWEQVWDHIQRTSAQKTLLLGKIMMGIHNVYERTVDDGGKELVDINDTDTQLDKVKRFFKDHQDMIKQYHTTVQRQNNVKKKHKAKLPTPTDDPKH